MRNINTVNNIVIANAAAEAGIRADEKYAVNIVSAENGLAEILFETEWNSVTCYIDTETGEVLGLMGEGKSTDELIADDYRAVRVNATAAAVRKIA